MGQLVLLVVAAAWAAVLVPPLLRSRIENRPNSSVSDFRNQLSSLQRAVPARGHTMRSMARPLAPSPLSRPAAPGRPVMPTRAHNGSQVRLTGATDRRRRPDPVRAYEPTRSRAHAERAARRPIPNREVVKRRRANVLFVLTLTAACSIFLAVTTKTQAMVWVAVIALAALLGYVCLLGQLRQREVAAARRPVRRAPRPEVGEYRRHAPRSAAPSAHRRPSAARRAEDRWSHAV
jgi:hypothetical protein